MNQNKNLPIKMGVLYGASLGVVVISIGIIRYKTGMILRGDQTLSLVYWIIFAATIFFVVFRFKKLDPPAFSFRETIKIGLLAGLLSGSMYTLYIVILNNYVDTELAAKVIQFSEQEIIQSNPELSEEEVAESTKFTKISSALRGLIYTFVCMAFGMVYSVVSTIIAKRLSINSGNS